MPRKKQQPPAKVMPVAVRRTVTQWTTVEVTVRPGATLAQCERAAERAARALPERAWDAPEIVGYQFHYQEGA